MPVTEATRYDHIVETACPLDCPDSCSLAVSVNEGKVVRIDGSRRNPITSGYICAKVRRFGERMYGDARLLHPGVRRGPKGSGLFGRVTWDEALDQIADRMRRIRDQWGGEAILPFSYGGSNGLLSQDTTDARLFRRFGSSRLARTVCAAPSGTANQAMYGKMIPVAFDDYVHARLIVIWGANPSVSGIHLVPHVREAQKRGAKLVVIDPRQTPLARQADLHLAVQPGTDVVVALALHRYLFEEGHADEAFLARAAHGADQLRERARPWTFDKAAQVARVDEAALTRFAELYATSSPALIRCGWGVERNRNGGNAILAILGLPAVAGKFGVRGGGYAMSASSAWNITRTWIGAEEPETRVVNMNHLGRALTEYDAPPVQMLFVYNANPAVTVPDQNRVLKGLGREDLFTVVFDQVMTDTAAWADVVLPATTFLEAHDFAKGYGSLSLQLVRPVVDAIGEARPNVEVFGDLCRLLGLEEPQDSADELEHLMELLDALPGTAGQQLREREIAELPCGSHPVQFVDVFPNTPDGKVNLFPADLERDMIGELYVFQPLAADRYPLTLISPASDKTVTSMLGELARGPAHLVMHPEDSAARGLKEEDEVRIFNDRGEVRCLLTVEPTIRPGTVSLPKGLWRKSTLNGATATALAPDTLTDLGGGACFNDARVEVERVS
jgi:anaerobic selenocysteine-containing dehydrogenase